MYCLRGEAMSDLRDALRSLRATPVVSAVAILSLALGIGANTAIFSLLDSLMLRTLPVREPQRLVMLKDGSWTNPIWEQIRARQDHFSDGAFAWSGTRFDLAAGGETDFANGIWASGRFFEVLGVPAILGRTFTTADDVRRGGPDGPVAVISYGFWQRHFGGAADVVGRSLTLERVPFTVIGVTGPGLLRPRRRPHLRRRHPDRRRAAAAARPQLARPAVVVVAEHHGPAQAGPDGPNRRRPRCAACSRRSARRRCPTAGGPRT